MEDKVAVLLLLLFVLSTIGVIKAQSSVEPLFQISNVSRVYGIFLNNYTTYVVGAQEGEIYVWKNSTGYFIGDGTVNKTASFQNLIVIVGERLVNGSKYPTMWIFNESLDRNTSVNINSIPIAVGFLRNFVLLVDVVREGNAQGIYLYAYAESNTKGPSTTYQIVSNVEPGNYGAVFLNYTISPSYTTTYLLTWYQVNGELQVSLTQIGLERNGVITGIPQLVNVTQGIATVISTPDEEILWVNPGHLYFAYGKYNVSGSLNLPNSTQYLNPVDVSVGEGYLCVLFPSTLVKINGQGVTYHNLSGNWSSVVPGPLNSTFLFGHGKVGVYEEDTLNTSKGPSVTQVLYAANGTAYLYGNGEIYTFNMFTGDFTSFQIGNLVGYLLTSDGIEYASMSGNTLNFDLLPYVPYYEASISLRNYSGNWTIELGLVKDEVSGTLLLVLPTNNASYQFKVYPAPGYKPLTGVLTQVNSTLSLNVVPKSFRVVFLETGLNQSSGESWGVQIGSQEFKTNSTFLVVNETIGVHNFTIIPPKYFKYTVNVTTAGLVKVTPTTFSVNLPNGTKLGGISVLVLIKFKEDQFRVNLSENGVKEWSVLINNTRYNLTGNSSVLLYPGTYLVRVLSIPNYSVLPSSVSLEVPQNASVYFNFTRNQNVTRETNQTTGVTKTNSTTTGTSNVTSSGTTPKGIFSSYYSRVVSFVIVLVIAILVAYRLRR
ncbi:hypothetical protein GWK48_07655 [Metallosphaera tengchongensis]|uniref:Uncharacterized protein n=1 Tax=Metallosphaera tengchongensis TaxID=1532350 RepID=A0A6N0NVM1_9CREN|nr:hypothetical protein GWK48_07655 [Metallosphaera tengchongensis]